mmetsp:Transcript_31321/g.67541  ORF Transcript_31321/g.67541 Transcript_31321/m.67541 type:complete len:237 (+) Transcript_31321:124-834(+)
MLLPGDKRVQLRFDLVQVLGIEPPSTLCKLYFDFSFIVWTLNHLSNFTFGNIIGRIRPQHQRAQLNGCSNHLARFEIPLPLGEFHSHSTFVGQILLHFSHMARRDIFIRSRPKGKHAWLKVAADQFLWLENLLLAFKINLQLSIVQLLDLTNQIGVFICHVHKCSFLEVGDIQLTSLYAEVALGETYLPPAVVINPNHFTKFTPFGHILVCLHPVDICPCLDIIHIIRLQMRRHGT